VSGSALILRADALRLPLPDESVDLIVSSPPYFALRSYRDGDEHYAGQLGSEPTPQAFLEALWAVMAECWRVLKPSGSCFINLGDKRAGSGGHNNGAYGVSGLHKDRAKSPTLEAGRAVKATLRNAPDRYNQAAFGRPKSKMLLPHRFAIGCEDGSASPCGCPKMGGYRCPAGMHRANLTCVLHGKCRTPWVVRSDIVWQKLNGLPESVTDRCRDSHEYLFHLTKSERYFAAVDEVREPQVETWRGKGELVRNGTGKAMLEGANNGFGLEGELVREYNPLGKLPGSVWALPSEPLIISDEVKAHYDLPDHFAAFPTELVRRVILGWSPSGICTGCGEGRRPVVAKKYTKAQNRIGNKYVDGLAADGTYGQNRPGSSSAPDLRCDATITGYSCACHDPRIVDRESRIPPTRPSVVLDIFGGTGTTAGVARALGRTGISVDLSHDYSRLADYLIHRSSRFAKTIRRTNEENQGSLL
jgi:DNA modification methylase